MGTVCGDESSLEGRPTLRPVPGWCPERVGKALGSPGRWPEHGGQGGDPRPGRVWVSAGPFACWSPGVLRREAATPAAAAPGLGGRLRLPSGCGQAALAAWEQGCCPHREGRHLGGSRARPPLVQDLGYL